MTAGTVLVLVCAWVALAAWRDWPGPWDLVAKLRDRRRVGRGDYRLRAVLHEAERPRALPVTTRPARGPCTGCGAAEDRWCDPRCTTVDPMDHR